MAIGDRWKLLALAALALAGPVGCGDDNGGTNPPGDLPAPANLQAAVQDLTIVLTWNAVSGATSYTVERDDQADQAGFETLATGVTQTTHTDTDVVEGDSYIYRVRAVSSTQTSNPSDPRLVSIGVRAAALSGEITANRTLFADTVYTLVGSVTVEDGATLTIEAGTTILGDSETDGNLIVRKGGRLVADGTATDPIVFTSERPVGQRARGDWGGVVLNGRSICNFPLSECIGEGNSGPYGEDPPVLDDDSGVLRYVRIEYAGDEISFGNELNGLTLNAVGSGTQLEFIQSHFGSDDGIEWFGGTVDLKYALVTGASDDSFDYSTGWQGRGQFWIVQQDPDDADNGFEVDGNEQDFSATPLTNPTIYNLTMIGKGGGGTAGESTTGLLLRRGTAGKIRNAIVQGFGTAGIDLDNDETLTQINAGELVVESSIFFDNAENFSSDADGIDEADVAMNTWAGNRVIDPQLTAPFDRAAPDFRPAAGSPTLDGFAAPPNDGFFDDVDFIGGVSPDGAPWYEGWTTTDLN